MVKLGGAQAPDGLDDAQCASVERAIDEAFVSCYRVVMLVAVATAPASAALLLRGKRPVGDAGKAIFDGEVAPDLPEP